MIYYEHRPTTKRLDKPSLVTKDELGGLTGFMSVFGFDESTASIIRSRGRMAGLGSENLFSDTMFLDFDNDPKAEDEAEEWLRDNNVGFDQYHTGNRGKHYHVPIIPISGPRINTDIKEFVRDTFPNADESIYKASAIIRLPNSYHEKNPGQRKRLLQSIAGDTLRIEQRPINLMPQVASVSSLGSNEAFLAALFRPVEEGGRNTKIFILGCLAKEAGLDEDEAYEVAINYNHMQVFPCLPDKEILSAIRSSYGFRR